MFSIGCCDIVVSGQVFRAGSLCALVNRIVVSMLSVLPRPSLSENNSLRGCGSCILLV